jgi:hypothetical protein
MNSQYGFDELAAAQQQPEVPVNAADRVLSAALAGEITINFAADADRTLLASDPADPDDEWFYRSIVFTDSGVLLTTGRSVFYPDVDDLYGGPSRATHIVTNLTARTLTFRRVGQTSGVAVTAGNRALIWHDGDEIKAIVNPLP